MIIGANAMAIIFEAGVVEGGTAPGHRPCNAGAREIAEVIKMPRSVEEILKHADELAKRFEDYEPRPEDERNVDAVLALRDAVVERSEAERHLSGAVAKARAA